jgi:hypothetical protein
LLLGSAFFSTFCFGNGLIVFPTLMALALILRWPWRWQFGMAVSTLFAAVLYTKILPGGAVNQLPSVSNILPGINAALTWLNSALYAAWMSFATWDVARIDYFASTMQIDPYIAKLALAVIGPENSLARSISIAHLLGAGTALMVVAILIRHLIIGVSSRLQLIALGLMIFCLGTGLLITLFRVEYFLNEANSQIFADRYVPWSCLWYLGIALYAIDFFRSKRIAKISFAIAGLLLAWLLNWSQIGNAVWARFAYDALQVSSISLMTNTLPPEHLGNVSTQNPERTAITLELLRKHELAYFYPEARIDALLANARLAQFQLTQFNAETPFSETPRRLAGGFTAALSDRTVTANLSRLRGYGPNQKICAIAWPTYSDDLLIKRQALGNLEKSMIRGLSLCPQAPDQLQWYALQSDTVLWKLAR